jgi:putative FmdB family regulatory protein
MPIYEYVCTACGQEFEFLTRAGIAPVCPECQSTEIMKLISGFSMRTQCEGGRMTANPSGCGGCNFNAPGGCHYSGEK